MPGDKKGYVVAGAILSCSYGTQLSRLKTPLCHGVYVKDKAQMNISDYVPMVNIMPFGNCKSLLNPMVQNGMVDIEGVQKAPCIPVVMEPWIQGKQDVSVEKQQALLDCCRNHCVYAGQIKIEDDGQEL